MRVLILRTTAADGRLVRAGETTEISESAARILVSGRKARPVVEAEVVAAEESANPVRRRGRPRKEP